MPSLWRHPQEPKTKKFFFTSRLEDLLIRYRFELLSSSVVWEVTTEQSQSHNSGFAVFKGFDHNVKTVGNFITSSFPLSNPENSFQSQNKFPIKPGQATMIVSGRLLHRVKPTNTKLFYCGILAQWKAQSVDFYLRLVQHTSHMQTLCQHAHLWAAERLFSGGAIVDFSRGSRKDFYKKGQERRSSILSTRN